MNTNSQSTYPLPQPTSFTKAFWDACQDKVLTVYACNDCGHLFLPGGPVCPQCWSSGLVSQPVSGRGTVYSFVIYQRTYHPAIPAPYVVALIALEEGPRLISNIINCASGNIVIDMPVRVMFETEDGFMLPRFEPFNPDQRNEG